MSKHYKVLRSEAEEALRQQFDVAVLRISDREQQDPGYSFFQRSALTHRVHYCSEKER